MLTLEQNSVLMRGLYANTDLMHTFAESVPLKRWGEMLDIVNLALYLAGGESSHMHGSLIRIDGGETLFRYSV
jgi:NAD(P)-dependent dehydrogenase (short-subunit alcohol dehydrogenase family)